jgi:hypothetical protein
MATVANAAMTPTHDVEPNALPAVRLIAWTFRAGNGHR